MKVEPILDKLIKSVKKREGGGGSLKKARYVKCRNHTLKSLPTIFYLVIIVVLITVMNTIY